MNAFETNMEYYNILFLIQVYIPFVQLQTNSFYNEEDTNNSLRKVSFGQRNYIPI